MLKQWARLARLPVFSCAAIGMVSCGSDQNSAAPENVGVSSLALNTSPTISNFVLYAERSLKLGSRDEIVGGDVGVRTAAPPAFGPQLTIGEFSSVERCHTLLAPSVSLAFRDEVGDVETSALDNHGGRLGTLAPFPGPAMPTLPLAPATIGGGGNVTVDRFGTHTLPPGNYGILNVAGTLILESGAYSFTSITLDDEATLWANPGGVNVYVSGPLTTGRRATLAPRRRDWWRRERTDADDLAIFVAASDGAGGSPPAVSIGKQNEIRALLAAPHGTLTVKDHSELTGAFVAFEIVVGDHSEATFQSGFSPTAPSQHGTQQLSGYLTPAMAAAPIVAPMPDSAIVDFSIGLPIRDPQGLQSFIRQVSDPTSPSYRQYLDVSGFAAQYGPTTSDYQALSSFAQSGGLTVANSYPNNLLLRVYGTAATVGSLFYTSFNIHQRPDGSQFYALDREPSVDFSIPILRVSGLDNYLIAVPGTGGTGSNQNFQGSDFRRAYVGSSSACAGLTGTNQSVGLFELGTFNTSDLTLYETLTGLSNVQLFQEPYATVTGGSSFCNPSNLQGDQKEVATDIEVVAAMAPSATIYTFSNQNCGGTGTSNPLFNLMATFQPRINQLSTSWFTDSDDNTAQVVQEFAAQGQSLFVISGDNGSYGSNPPVGIQLTASPYATIVGGTQLSMSGGSLPSYLSETTWNDQNGASGGGFFGPYAPGPFTTGPSVLNVPLPYYQSCTGSAGNGCSTQFRNFPDVSAVSESIVSCVFGQCNGGFWGTSFSTPLWAAFAALINQQGQMNGVPPVGFLNPALYEIANTGMYGGAFNDVTTGNNNGFSAVPGYDLATGLGTPKCGLIYDLVGGSTPPPPPPGGAAVSVSATETMLGPTVCVTGSGWAPGGAIHTEYFGIPGRTAPFAGAGGVTVQPDGTFNVGPDQQGLDQSNCTSNQLLNVVTIVATQEDSMGHMIASSSAKMPATYWCAGSVPTDLNGGCP